MPITARALTLFILLLSFLATPAHAEGRYALAMYGEPKYPPNFTHFAYTNPNAPKGGMIRFGEEGTFDNLNPYILKGVPAAGLVELSFETLMEASRDEPFSQYGLIAETVEVAKDRKSVTYVLRQEARWHDGTPITVDDVIFSLETLVKEGNPIYRIIYRDVEKAEKIGPRTVRFTFSNAENRQLPLLVGQLPILSKNYFSKHKFNQSTLTPVMASGPYQVDKVDPGRSIRYKRIKNYWGRNLPVNRGRFNFDYVRYDYYRDMTVAVQAFKAGEFDYRYENIAKNWAKEYNIPAVKNGEIIKVAIPNEVPTGMQGFVLNTRRSNLSDRRMREALNYAYDYEWANRNLFYSMYARTRSYFSNSEFASEGLPHGKELALLEPYRDQLPPEVFTKEYIPPITDGSGNNRENLKKARDLLEQAGWHIKDKKLINPHTGKPVVLEFLMVSPAFVRVVGPMVRNLKRLGIEAKIRVVDLAQYQKRMENFDFDITIYTYLQSLAPGNEQINYWHSEKANVPGSMNYAGVNDPVVDAMVDRLVKVESKEDLLAAAHALDRVLLWNYYVVPNWHIRTFRILYRNSFNRPKITPKYDPGLDTWWKKPEKKK